MPLLFILPKDAIVPFVIIVLLINLILIIRHLNWIFGSKNLFPILFAISFFILGIFTFYEKDVPITYAIIPMTSIFAYHYIQHFKFQFVILDLFIISLYIYFIFYYFSSLNSFWYRPDYGEGEVFSVSSSNSISISLNIILSIYIILSVYYGKGDTKLILLFSIINIVLILIQQSRMGVAVAFVNFLTYFLVIRKVTFSKLILLFSFFMILYVIYFNKISNYLNMIGGINLFVLQADNRTLANTVFFNNLTTYRIFWGYPIDYIYAPGIEYIYNVFLSMWNNYTIFSLIVFIIVFANRCINYKKYFFPLVLFLPFLMYGWVEPRFFPAYWDFFIYLLLFVKKDMVVIHDKVY